MLAEVMLWCHVEVEEIDRESILSKDTSHRKTTSFMPANTETPHIRSKYTFIDVHEGAAITHVENRRP